MHGISPQYHTSYQRLAIGAAYVLESYHAAKKSLSYEVTIILNFRKTSVRVWRATMPLWHSLWQLVYIHAVSQRQQTRQDLSLPQRLLVRTDLLNDPAHILPHTLPIASSNASQVAAIPAPDVCAYPVWHAGDCDDSHVHLRRRRRWAMAVLPLSEAHEALLKSSDQPRLSL